MRTIVAKVSPFDTLRLILAQASEEERAAIQGALYEAEGHPGCGCLAVAAEHCQLAKVEALGFVAQDLWLRLGVTPAMLAHAKPCKCPCHGEEISPRGEGEPPQ